MTEASFNWSVKYMHEFCLYNLSISTKFSNTVPYVENSLTPILRGFGMINDLWKLVMIIFMFVNRSGFWSAMASNLTNQSRNVLSKKFMVKKEVSFRFAV